MKFEYTARAKRIAKMQARLERLQKGTVGWNDLSKELEIQLAYALIEKAEWDRK